MKIIFQNEHFVAVDKASGWLTTPSRMGKEDPRPVVGLQLQQTLQKQVFPVHRLDFEVSGLVLFALSAEAHSKANTLFENRQVRKTYQALTENKNPQTPSIGETLEWKARILRGKKRAFESPHGKPSLTQAKFLKEEKGRLSWELHPVTGRSHQLRFDLSRHGYPICGDVLYGAQALNLPDRIELRAFRIQLLDAQFCQKWMLPSEMQTDPLF